MLQIAKRTTVGLIVLLAMPVTVWMSGWHWQPGGTDYILKALFAMTETVTSPWGALTSIILAGWFLW
ncbi:phosphatidylglycerophosphatase B, partial [Escherichia coli]|nr:phosphatidylglycerophosphatase B [Escherichia coli]